MSANHDHVDRRDFLKNAGGASLALGIANSAFAARGGKSSAASGRVIGANDRINIGVIGVGGETSTSYLPSMRLMAANLDRLPFDRIVSHRMPHAGLSGCGALKHRLVMYAAGRACAPHSSGRTYSATRTQRDRSRAGFPPNSSATSWG